MDENESRITGIDDIIAALNIIQMAGDVDKFKAWLKKEHKLSNFKDIFQGYSFFLESAVRTLINALIYNPALGIEEDFVFFRARFVGVEISKTYNTCDKTILIKNINEKLKSIKRARSYEELKSAITDFKSTTAVFWEIYAEDIAVNSQTKINKEKALEYLTMFYTLTFLNDTERAIPHGYWTSILNNRIDPKRYEKSFKGYKYTLQFVWSVLLGRKYHSTSAKDLHRASNWIILDSYYGKIRDEIIAQIEKELKTNLIIPETLYLKKRVRREKFKDLLKPPKEPQLNEKEKLDFNLLWYPIELLDSSKSHIFNGAPAFIYLLSGAAERKRRSPEKEEVYVCKFVHPVRLSDKGAKDFSYGVLVEAFGSTGISDYSGWVLFFDCCGNYAGLPGYGYLMAEELISRYKREGLIEVREMIIDKDKLKGYIADKLTSNDKRKEIIRSLEKESELKREKNTVAAAQGLVLELITYYMFSREGHCVEWDIKINEDQLDVVLEKKDELTIIECKINPNNLDINSEVEKLKTKLDKYKTTKRKNYEFWFWHRPRQEIIDRLKKEKVGFVVASELIDRSPLWRNKKMDKLNTIFEGSKNIGGLRYD